MTLREWMKKNRPEDVKPNYTGGVLGCPHHYGIEYERAKDCGFGGDSEEVCRKCWDREMKDGQVLPAD